MKNSWAERETVNNQSINPTVCWNSHGYELCPFVSGHMRRNLFKSFYVKRKKSLAVAFNSTSRYINILSINNNQFHSYVDSILENKGTTECSTSALYLDLLYIPINVLCSDTVNFANLIWFSVSPHCRLLLSKTDDAPDQYSLKLMTSQWKWYAQKIILLFIRVFDLLK